MRISRDFTNIACQLVYTGMRTLTTSHPLLGKRLPAKDKNKAVLPIVLSDAVRYDIQGTLATHTLRRGESLARLAERYYGNRNLWTYLARYNRNNIKDANDIPVGTLIRIPKLVPKE